VLPPDAARLRQLLQSFDFQALFIDALGWDRHSKEISVSVDGLTYILRAIAQKRGFQVYECAAYDGARIPDYPTRSKIERQLAKLAHEHILIYTDVEKSTQKWQWVRDKLGRPLARREYDFFKGQTGDQLVQILQYLAIDLSEEESLTLVDVTRRAGVFDIDRVTRQFYERFKIEHDRFLKFVKGISTVSDREWYASLMLNRLMFVYFIQKKGFLDGDLDYLRHRLQTVRERKGKDKFLTFYHYFLVRLFHEGLGQPPTLRKADLEELLGKVPYLNGGLFDVHDLEKTYPNIQIADEAFERLFGFFDAYRWHLDERPLRSNNEINPDVLGYIFEKYINQRQMGAYYTKEDITDYIARNALIPFLFSTVQRGASGLKLDLAVKRLVRDNPERYIFSAVKNGTDLPLPPEIAIGIDNVSKRERWNAAVLPGYGVVTETWREHIARRQHLKALRSRLKGTDLDVVSDLVNDNLNVCQLTQDVIENCDDPELLQGLHHAISNISILDPTCGSGAFLFAALNILEPLYEACLDRMKSFVDDIPGTTSNNASDVFSEFREILTIVARHQSRRYFILKSIVVGNLYGVDIMEEAVEICKLRLFLKLVSQVNDLNAVEPLPDIDFNIRCGNTLVGYASLDEVRATLEGTLGFARNDVNLIEEKAELADQAFTRFRKLQITAEINTRAAASVKSDLKARLDSLRDELDRYLADSYATKGRSQFDRWHTSHQPFHWFVEFFGLMHGKGFDVVIGNPPYVECEKVNQIYKVLPGQYRSEKTGNLYALCMERSISLLGKNGRFGMIVPAGIMGIAEAQSLRELLLGRYEQVFCSTYAIRPSKLFDGVDQRLCIFLGNSGSKDRQINTTRYHHWTAAERASLFSTLVYVPSLYLNRLKRIAQLGNDEAISILNKLEARAGKVISAYYGDARSGFLMHYHRSPRYWIRALDFEPHFKSDTQSRSIHHFRDLYLQDERSGKIIGAILNSSLFFFWFMCVGNGRNITGADVADFPVGELTGPSVNRVPHSFDRLMEDYKRNSFIRQRTDCEFQEFRQGKSKPIIDSIDRALARHYDFSDKELDFIINYEIKYRLGDDETGET